MSPSKKRVLIVAALTASVVAGATVGGRGAFSEFLGYINGRGRRPEPDSVANRIGVGLFRGTGHSPSDPLEADEAINPFTDRPFGPENVFGFGQQGFFKDLPRAVADHFGITLFSSTSAIQRKTFDVLICHSDGCAVAISELESGRIHTKTLIALGANWTYRNPPQGNFGGARTIFFQMDGDPVPAVLGRLVPKLEKVGSSLGIAFDFQFGPGEPTVIPLANHSGKGPHALATYFAGIREWMHQEGELQQEVKKIFDQAGRDDAEVRIANEKRDEDRRKKPHPKDFAAGNGCGTDCGSGPRVGGQGGGGRGDGGPGGPGGGGRFDSGGGGGHSIQHKDNGGVEGAVTIQENDIWRKR